MKVKIFYNDKPDSHAWGSITDVENELNEWLINNEGIKIEKIIQSLSSGGGTAHIVITIFYKEMPKEVEKHETVKSYREF